jgi:hypothetical protein
MKRNHLFICLLLLLVVAVIPATASPVISSISPATAPNNGDVTVTITGTGFNAVSKVWISADTTGSVIYGTVVSWSPTSIICTFPLNGQTPAKFNVFVNTPFTDPAGGYWPQDVGILDLGFDITQGTGTVSTTATTLETTTPTTVPADGSIFVSSFPSGANIYLDNEYKGLTPYTLKKVENGRHTVLVRLTGYRDWITNVVISGDSESLSARLVSITPTTTAPVTTPSPTPVATVPRTFAPLGTELGIIATMGAALLLLKRK